MTEPHADWFPAGHRPDPEDFAKQLDADPPEDPDDLGSVFINWITLEEDRWTVSWQRGDDHRSLDVGTRAEAFAWAYAQEASHYWIFSAQEDGWVTIGRDQLLS